MFRWLRHLFKQHQWFTTHTNQWQIPTRQRCLVTGLTREADTGRAISLLSYCWVYSDGHVSKEYSLGSGLDDRHFPRS